jgi:hypothetical protein
MSAEFEDYFNEVKNSLTQRVGGNKPYAEKLVQKEYFRIKTGFYEDENPSELIDELSFTVNESIKKGLITCNKCGWEWKKSEGGKDTYDCHKCGNKNNNLNESLITERSKTDLPVRTIVRDITDFIKLKMDDTTYLPEDKGGDEMEYSFEGLPLFSVEVTTDWDPTMEQEYLIDGQTVDDGDIIEIYMKINPSYFPQSLYDIIGDLNDNVRHEMEHVLQDAGYRSPEEVRLDDEPVPTDKTYYMQPHEVPAEIKGFRRLVKLRNQPVEEVIKSWFVRNKPIHQLPDEDIEELTQFLTQKYKEYYGG